MDFPAHGEQNEPSPIFIPCCSHELQGIIFIHYIIDVSVKLATEVIK